MPNSYYNFNRNDIFVNTVELFPKIKFLIYSGTAYYNNLPNISGSFADPIRLTSASHLSLYELNIDRAFSSTGRYIGPTDAKDASGDPARVNDTGLIYPFIYKDGSRLNLRTSTSEAFAGTPLGAIISGSYPLTASITKTFYTATGPRHSPLQSSALTGQSVSNIRALKNTINEYRLMSPYFEYSSSVSSITCGISNRDFDSSSLGLVGIPTIMYGSEIKRGTVSLEFYRTGTLLARAEDTKRNGELIQTYGTASLLDTVIGLVLYNEGFLILTSSATLGTDQDYYTSSIGLSVPNWTYFASSISGSITAPSSSFLMTMSGTTNTQVITIFATAPKGELNHSNNPSYLKYDYAPLISTGSRGYIEDPQTQIKNVVSSAYNDPTGSFEKTTYISKVALYDKNKNLIGIAKTATPIKKTVERDFTFKLKLDI